MSRRTTSPHPAQQPAGGRVGWMVAGGLVLAGMATYAVVLFTWQKIPALRMARMRQAGPMRPAGALRRPSPTPLLLPAPAPEGMVWIPGGGFSMGSNDTAESLCSLPGVTRDAQPIVRVICQGLPFNKKPPASCLTGGCCPYSS